MKKFILSALVALFCITNAALAQGSLLATLNHEGTVSTFYGATALRDAHAAATHGDVITLSSGMFLSTDITKAITLRGSGMQVDSVLKTEPTIISGDFNIKISDKTDKHLTLEGIYSDYKITYADTLRNAVFLKNRFKNLNPKYVKTDKIKDAVFIHCFISNMFYLSDESSAQCINCVIRYPFGENLDLQNCVLSLVDANISLIASAFKNCILVCANNNYIRPENVAYNNVGVGSSMLFKYANNTSNSYSTFDELFKTYKGADFDGIDSENFELTDAAKKKFLGIDGTQVGIYGGSLPYDPTPTNPQITKCNVAGKSTADGKLSVDIEVKVAE